VSQSPYEVDGYESHLSVSLIKDFLTANSGCLINFKGNNFDFHILLLSIGAGERKFSSLVYKIHVISFKYAVKISKYFILMFDQKI